MHRRQEDRPRYAPGPQGGIGVYARIYDLVRGVPRGRVVTYGQIAAALGRCTPRMVGYAMAALPVWEADVPWQRVINGRGEVSPRTRGEGHAEQRRLLEAEGVIFDARGRVDLKRYRWEGLAEPPRTLRSRRAAGQPPAPGPPDASGRPD